MNCNQFEFRNGCGKGRNGASVEAPEMTDHCLLSTYGSEDEVTEKWRILETISTLPRAGCKARTAGLPTNVSGHGPTV